MVKREKIRLWFEEWNARGTVPAWEMRQFFLTKDNQTVAEWHFKCMVNGGKTEEFDGMPLIVWNGQNRMQFLKEFG